MNGNEDPSHDWGGASGLDLSSWLERPILAATHIWEVGSPFPVIYFNPWAHFLDSPSVAQKISNFYLMRCKMHMKVIVNGSAMHYGRGMISYRPMMTEPGERYQYDPNNLLDPFESVGHDSLTNIVVENSAETCTMMQSQWPKIFIDPGQSMGGEMEFPFFFGANWFRIPKRDWVSQPSSVEPYLAGFDRYSLNNESTPNKALGPYGATKTHMGVVHSSSLAILKHSNGADDPVTIQVFLWASDVKLSVPTSANHPDAMLVPPSEFVPKSRTEYVPEFLGDLAKPGSDIADRLEFGGSALNTSSATVGLGDDSDMSINNIASRECWLSEFTWRVDDPAETALWMAHVTPQYIKQNDAVSVVSPVTGPPAVMPTPSCYASLPFSYWRGSMTYRIQIVASNLHRGRLRIVYDPFADLNFRFNVNDYPEELMNLQYSRTIDIAGESGRDFTFSVGYMQATPYLPLLQLPHKEADTVSDYRWTNYGNPSTTFGLDAIRHHSTTANGAFTVYVLNRLAVPATMPGLNNDVSIQVYASAGKDMDFQMPTTKNLNVISFADPTGFPPNFRNDEIPVRVGNFGARYPIPPASRFIPKMDSASMGATEMENVPVDPPEMATIGDVSQPAGNMASVAFGETMTSWDQMMSRWTKYNREIFCPTDQSNQFANRASTDVHMVICPDFPPFPGPSPCNGSWFGKTGTYNGTLDSVRAVIPTKPVEGEWDIPYANCGVNPPPPSKVILNIPVRNSTGSLTIEPEDTDVNFSLRYNPGNITMLHFVTRMFIGRKGSLKNKYVLGGNMNLSGAGGSMNFNVKRLSDSGTITGAGLWPGTSGASASITAEETLRSTIAVPASGGLWDQGYCRFTYAQLMSSTEQTPVSRFQAVGGQTLSGAKVQSAPNWFSAMNYPGNGWHTDAVPYSYSGDTSDEILGHEFEGVHVTTSKQQPVIEVEVPFYMNTRFILNDLVFTNTTATSAHLVSWETGQPSTILTSIDNRLNGATMNYLDRYTVPGSDFALYYLANVPLILLNGAHRYQTRVGLGTPASPFEAGLVSYGNARFVNGGRQEICAHNTDYGNGLSNSYFNRTYFYELSQRAHGRGVAPVPGNMRPVDPP